MSRESVPRRRGDHAPELVGRGPGAGRKFAPEGEPQLLGLVCGHFELDQDIAFQNDESVKARIAQNTGVATVIPASDIAVELADEKLRDPRTALEAAP
jgi:hypothetical protein